MRFFKFFEIPRELNLRPLLLAAGAAAVTAGAYYLLSSKFRRRRLRGTSVDVVTQPDPEGHDVSPEDVSDDLLVLNGGFIRRLDIHQPECMLGTNAPMQIQPHLPLRVRDDLLVLYDGFIRRRDIHQPEETTDKNRQRTVSLLYLNEETVYNFPGLFVEHLVHGEMHSAFRTVLFSHRWWHNYGKRRICVMRHCALLMRGPVTFAWWILTNDFLAGSGKTPRLYATTTRVTVTKSVAGHLTRVTSFMFSNENISKTSSGVQEKMVSRTGQALIIAHDMYEYCEFSDVVPQPEASTSSQPAGPEAAGGSSSAVAREVPSLYTYSEIQRIGNFALKMKALRQAFNVILSEKECLEYVCETSKMIFGDLATLNNKDLTLFEYLYDTLLSIAQSPSYRADVEAELAEIGIQHFNFMDVVYEIVMFRVQAGTGPKICPRQGGFLHHLMALLSSFSAPTSQSWPRAEQYFQLIQNALMVLLEKILTLEDSVYEDPESLVQLVWDTFEDDIEDLLDRLEDI